MGAKIGPNGIEQQQAGGKSWTDSHGAGATVMIAAIQTGSTAKALPTASHARPHILLDRVLSFSIVTEDSTG